MKIVATGINDENALASLRKLAARDELWLANPAAMTARDRTAFFEAEVVLGGVPPDLIGSAKSLRWIQLLAVGLDTYRAVDWLQIAPRVVCTNLRGVFAETMAQSVLAGLLAFNRGVDHAIRLQASRDWKKDFLHARGRVLQRDRVLLLGGGSVANRLKELLGVFGCSFTTFARTSGDIQTRAELDAALPHADIVCAALPETLDTRGLLDARRIGLLKPGVLFANVGRGSLLDEAALIAALHSGRIRGAVIDVTQQEPLRPDHPLWLCPNLLLTQHSSAGSHDELSRAVEFFGANLARYRAGEVLMNIVDWTRGY